jgi:hypothetical protein
VLSAKVHVEIGKPWPFPTIIPVGPLLFSTFKPERSIAVWTCRAEWKAVLDSHFAIVREGRKKPPSAPANKKDAPLRLFLHQPQLLHSHFGCPENINGASSNSDVGVGRIHLISCPDKGNARNVRSIPYRNIKKCALVVELDRPHFQSQGCIHRETRKEQNISKAGDSRDSIFFGTCGQTEGMSRADLSLPAGKISPHPCFLMLSRSPTTLGNGHTIGHQKRS